MVEIVEGQITFSFPDNCEAGKYDKWSFYRNQFQNIAGGSKAVDILCLEGDNAWLIEVKDYRQHPRTKAVDIADEIAMKVRDTVAGLAAAGKNANDDDERRLACRALRKRRWRVVLHLEQPASPRRLRRKAITEASLLQKLRSRHLKAIDAHPAIDNMTAPRPGIPWSAA